MKDMKAKEAFSCISSISFISRRSKIPIKERYGRNVGMEDIEAHFPSFPHILHTYVILN